MKTVYKKDYVHLSWWSTRAYVRMPKLLAAACVLAVTAFSWGCAGVVSWQNQSNPPPPPTYTISGTISPSAGGSGATATLSGAATATTTAGSSGAYTFTGLANGTYVVTPSHTGYTFSPTSQNATINGANVAGINFAAIAAQTHSVLLSWTASTSAVSGYNVYRSTVNGSGYVRINSVLVSTPSYTDVNVQSGTTYYYVTTAMDSTGGESSFSNEATAVIP